MLFKQFIGSCALLMAVMPVQADSLVEIYELALVNDPQLSAAEAAYRANRESVNIRRAALLPQISAVASYQESEQNVNSVSVLSDTTTFTRKGDVDNDTESVSVSLSQPLFDVSAWFDFKQGKQTSEQARLTFTDEKQQQILNVADAYFNVLRISENLATARAEETALERQLQQTRERFEVGLLPITDVHEAQAAYDNAVVNTLEFRGELGIAFEALEILTGQPHHELSGLVATFPVVSPMPQEVNEWVSFSLANNPGLKASEYAMLAADYNARARKAEHLPTVTGSLSYTNNDSEGDSLGNPSSDETEGGLAKVELRVPIFTGGLTSANRRQATQQAIQSKQQYMSNKRNTVQQTRSNHLQVVTNVARVKARNQAVTSAESALEATQAGYDVGTRNIVDVLNAQRVLFQAKRDYANARYDYINSYLALKKVSGQLSPEDLYQLNNWLSPSLAVVRAAQ